MKYMILSYASQRDYDAMTGGGESGWSPEEFAGMVAFMTEFNRALAESGELVETRGLAAPVHTRRVGSKDGKPFVTDGPYAETQEVLAGYWIVECESFNRAIEIAARFSECPAPQHIRDRAYADVRPLQDSAPEFD
ncbi:YciI family protein [Nocardia arthritidis]|nr:YciI family protein [Nocardia arthritidis]